MIEIGLNWKQKTKIRGIAVICAKVRQSRGEFNSLYMQFCRLQYKL